MKKGNDNELSNSNIVQLELNIEPAKFTTDILNQFVHKLEIFFQQPKFKLTKPKVNLINIHVSTRSKRANVLFEFFLTVLGSSNERNSPMSIVNNDYTSKSLIYNDKQFKINDNQKLLKSQDVLKLLRTEMPSVYSWVNYLLILLTNAKQLEDTKTESSISYLGLDIIEIKQLTCDNGNYSRSFNCSNHGVCDPFSHKCICDKYWMPNLYLYYSNNGAELTNGNNCEWNAPFVTFITIILTIIIVYITIRILKFIFYYLCCCCCCRFFNKNKSKLSSSSYDKEINDADNLKRCRDIFTEQNGNFNPKFRSSTNKLRQNAPSSISSNRLKNLTNTLKNKLTLSKNKNKNNRYSLLDNGEDRPLNSGISIII
jgi:hypothetical protein